MQHDPLTIWRTMESLRKVYGHHKKPIKALGLVSNDGRMATIDQEVREDAFLQGEVFRIQSSYSREAVDNPSPPIADNNFRRSIEHQELQ